MKHITKILLTVLLLLPASADAASPIPWTRANATNTFTSPALQDSLLLGATAAYFKASSTTASNSFLGNTSIGTTTSSKLLYVAGNQSGGIVRFDRVTAGIASSLFGTQDVNLWDTAPGNDALGPAETFSYTNGTTGTHNILAQLGAIRAAADNVGTLVFEPLSAGSVAANLVVSGVNGIVATGTTSPSTTECNGTVSFCNINFATFANPGALYTSLASSTALVNSIFGSKDTNGTAAGLVAEAGTVSNNDFDFLTNNTVQMVLTKTGRLGVGTTSPKELFNLSQSTGFTTVRVDSGTHSGYLSTNDSFPGTYVGANSNDPVYLVSNNAAVAQAYTLSGQSNIFEVDAPSGNPLESDLATVLQTSAGNRRFVDWDLENFPTDQFASIVIAKQGTGKLEPFGVRFWNQDLGDVASTGWWTFLTDPSGATAIGTYSSTTYDKTIPAQVGASSTATTEFAVDSATGAHILTVARTGTTTSTNGFNITGGCFSISSVCISGSSGSGASSTLLSDNNTFSGNDVFNAAPSIGVNTNGLLLGSVILAYASSTNGATCFGLTACGSATTTTTNNGTTAFGSGAGAALTTGANNTYLGYQTGLNATSTTRNTAVGYAALKGGSTIVSGTGSNTAIGYQSMGGITIGINNTSTGVNAAQTLTGGNNNVAVGLQALQLDSTGSQDVAIGQSTLLNTTGDDNVGVGYSAALGNTSGTKNVAIGRESLNFNQSGTDNVDIGYRAGFGVSSNSNSKNVLIGEFAANAVTTGSGNVFLGFQAGKSLTTGASNIVIGQNVDVPVISGNGQLNIGNVIFGTGFYNNSSTLSSTALTTGLVGFATSTPDATISDWGSLALNVNDQGANYVVATSTDFLIAITSTASARTVTLPFCSATSTGSVTDKLEYEIKDESGAAATNNVTISPVSSQKIDGATNKVINTNYGFFKVYCDGQNSGGAWYTM